MPEKCAMLLNELGVKPERRTVEWAQKGKDLEYGANVLRPSSGHGDAAFESLFPPVPAAELLDEEVVAGVTEVPKVVKGSKKSKAQKTSSSEVKETEEEVESKEEESKGEEVPSRDESK